MLKRQLVPSRFQRLDQQAAKCIAAAVFLLMAHSQVRGQTTVELSGQNWLINGRPTNPGSAAEGLLMNVRMVNATFEDLKRTDFDADANCEEFIARIGDYAKQGVNAFTLCLQGGMPGYEGALNSAFDPDGSLRESYVTRVERVLRECDRQGMVVILGLFYQRQSKILRDEAAVRAAVTNAVTWMQATGFKNVLVEIANEYPHRGFAHDVIRTSSGQAALLTLAKETAPQLLFTTSGYGDGRIDPEVAAACDFLAPHWNSTAVNDIPERVARLKRFGKPIVCNEDDKTGQSAVDAMKISIATGAGYGLMLQKRNQTWPFRFGGAADDLIFYVALLEVTGRAAHLGETDKSVSAEGYFPPSESQGGWRGLDGEEALRQVGGVDPSAIGRLRQWLLQSDDRQFAAVVIHHGHVVLQVERGRDAAKDAQRVASLSKAVCATVLAIASQQSQEGRTPLRMTFDDPAFNYIPWAVPLSDLRKSKITVRQLLNHTSGICPESAGAPNDGRWSYVLGHSGDPRTQQLAFDPGTACGYSTHALAHAALVCETVTGKPYDQFAIESLFLPLGIESWWFQFYDDEVVGRKPSHGLGMPARDLARIGYCMLHEGRWQHKQVIPKWFVEQTGKPSHTVTTPELRWQLNPQVFTVGWEMPALHFPESQKHIAGIPADARYKPGSGGQLLAFVPSLDLVIARQTGESGAWDYEEFLRQACECVIR